MSHGATQLRCAAGVMPGTGADAGPVSGGRDSSRPSSGGGAAHGAAAPRRVCGGLAGRARTSDCRGAGSRARCVLGARRTALPCPVERPSRQPADQARAGKGGQVIGELTAVARWGPTPYPLPWIYCPSEWRARYIASLRGGIGAPCLVGAQLIAPAHVVRRGTRLTNRLVAGSVREQRLSISDALVLASRGGCHTRSPLVLSVCRRNSPRAGYITPLRRTSAWTMTFLLCCALENKVGAGRRSLQRVYWVASRRGSSSRINRYYFPYRVVRRLCRNRGAEGRPGRGETRHKSRSTAGDGETVAAV